jgi:hypothetical protein
MSNELVDLTLFHGRHLGLFTFNATQMRERYQGSDFSSSAWLPLYEVHRRGWDTSASFAKIATADDRNGLYQHLRVNNTEFYVTDQEYLEVTAFDNWNLTQQDFGDHAERNEYRPLWNYLRHIIDY